MLSDKITPKFFWVLLLPFLFFSCASLRVGRNSISPYDYGLSDAKNGVERYNVLLKTHQYAVQHGIDVSYKGIRRIEIEIPKNAVRIPLTDNNDFSGCEFVITNKQKTVYLFESLAPSKSIIVSKSDIDKGDFRRYPALSKGNHILLIEDSNPWVENRKGYDYGHIRRDILLVSGGKSQNRVIMPYDNEQSNPKCSYLEAAPFTFKNLTVRRTEDCTAITNIMFVTGKDGVDILNVSLHTPDNEWRNDRAIRIEDCTNVHFENVLIDGTYSQIGHSGYGISLNTIWNFSGKQIVGRGNWGIFGTNNVNTVHIEHSRINRFDIHCYGRDVFFKQVDFFDKYNQLNSVYGSIVFDECSFTKFDPIRIGSSYNAYVPFDVYFNDCIFHVTKGNNYLLRLGEIDDVKNSRKELVDKCWPNVYIKNLTVNLDETASEFVLFYTKIDGKESNTPIHFLSTVEVNGLAVNSPKENVQISITPKPVKLVNKVDCSMIDVTVNGRSLENVKSVRMKTNIPLQRDAILFKSSSKHSPF